MPISKAVAACNHCDSLKNKTALWEAKLALFDGRLKTTEARREEERQRVRHEIAGAVARSPDCAQLRSQGWEAQRQHIETLFSDRNYLLQDRYDTIDEGNRNARAIFVARLDALRTELADAEAACAAFAAGEASTPAGEDRYASYGYTPKSTPQERHALRVEAIELKARLITEARVARESARDAREQRQAQAKAQAAAAWQAKLDNWAAIRAAKVR